MNKIILVNEQDIQEKILNTIKKSFNKKLFIIIS